jgi:ABC-type uncharacterized transport system, permease component
MKLKKYLTLIRTSAQRAVAYRMNFIISSGITFVLFFSSFYLWKCIYLGRASIASYSWDNMKTYLFVSFISSGFLSWYAESGLSKKILDGTVEMDLVKPFSFQYARLAESLGSTIFETIVVVVLAVPIKFIFSIPMPGKVCAWLLFILSLLIAILCKFGVIYIFSMFCFYTTSHVGVSWARQAITNLLSGAVIPLTFLPPEIRAVINTLPFKYIVDIPANIFIGNYGTSSLITLLGVGLFWIVLLFMLGKLLYSLFIRKITINGG